MKTAPHAPPLPPSRREGGSATLRAIVSMLLLGLGAAACGKTMTKEECERVGTHMRQVWDTETEAAAPPGARSVRAANAIKSEGDKMQAEWKTLCERDLEGRKVDEQEVECMLGAKTVAEIQLCGAKKK